MYITKQDNTIVLTSETPNVDNCYNTTNLMQFVEQLTVVDLTVSFDAGDDVKHWLYRCIMEIYNQPRSEEAQTMFEQLMYVYAQQ